ncbi:MAG: DUF2202 domain-containing protein [Anaerolineaceae bacterium]
MKNNKLSIFIILTAILAAGLFALNQTSIVSAASFSGRGPGGQGGPGAPNGTGQGPAQAGTGLALTPLSGEETEALQTAILEEYGALNLYQSVMEQLGDVYPFNQIALAEQQHVNALVLQAEKYNITIPQNPGLEVRTVFTTLQEACQMGVKVETADVELYNELIAVTAHTDLLRVYSNLQTASLENHLTAFQICD